MSLTSNSPRLSLVPLQELVQELGIAQNLFSDPILVSHTGNTTVTTLKTYTIPANSMGPNGFVSVRFAGQHTSSANNKLYKIFFGGTQVLGNSVTTSATVLFNLTISNINSNSSQKSTSGNGYDSTSGNAFPISSIDTTQDVSMTIAGQLTNSGESVAIADVIVSVTYKD
jgi:hypothetical protein